MSTEGGATISLVEIFNPIIMTGLNLELSRRPPRASISAFRDSPFWVLSVRNPSDPLHWFRLKVFLGWRSMMDFHLMDYIESRVVKLFGLTARILFSSRPIWVWWAQSSPVVGP
ncbi:LOW QUALITY PROTEIN: hypothetical protein TorRG33x02_042660 [Trema orientale]|uniref:Uncharacterized protein n=1 Tax=Trema orientale TaxID=63057 RepID=A0A2P5FPY4_TREOI|nr:LOW QUALITY PROTEIN: hypothetical protein TorRG33x02_042660 [Trema orientale]